MVGWVFVDHWGGIGGGKMVGLGRWWVGMLLYCALHAATRALVASEKNPHQPLAFMQGLPVSGRCRVRRADSSFLCMSRTNGKTEGNVRPFEVGDIVLTEGKSGVLTQYKNGWWTVSLQEGSVVKRRTKALAVGKNQTNMDDSSKASTVKAQTKPSEESSSPIDRKSAPARRKQGGRALDPNSKPATSTTTSDSLGSDKEGTSAEQRQKGPPPSSSKQPRKEKSAPRLSAR
eukprot:766300-Hanusia_phi.AAC.1